MLLILDNFDSFTYNLVDYFEQLGVKCKVLRNNHPLEDIVLHQYHGIVLSPGPETPIKAGNLMKVLKYYENKLPILGICLGHQAIGEYYGAALIKAIKPMHGKISSINLLSDILFNAMPKCINVVRYNSLILDSLPDELKLLAYTANNEVMAIKHKQLPIWGVQFHPEAALTQEGLLILKNWLDYNQIS